MTGEYRRAIAVAGHAVLRDERAPALDESWFLLPYQQGEAACIVEHVRAAVLAAAEDPAALLIFSGGATRPAAGPRTEALSHWLVAEAHEWFGRAEIRDRALTEEFARDSFENLLLGVCRFKEYAGAWPLHLTLVSWAFMEERFHLHREACRWPRERFAYLGPNDPPQREQALLSEAAARDRYRADPYRSGPFFRAKRDERNSQRRRHAFHYPRGGLKSSPAEVK
jgi:hypothetical protein